MQQFPHTMEQFLQLWWTVITMASLSKEIILFNPSLPTSLKRTSFESSNTSSLPSPFQVQYKYVPSHAGKKKKWWDCTLKERMNINVDRLAKKALKAAHCTGQYIKTTFPNEQIWITLFGRKVIGSVREELEEY
jgi:hypothetical protein